MPIGNLTSQIFANIYLNELDRFVKNIIRPQAYLRYGDDFIILTEKFDELVGIKEKIKNFAWEKLRLELNSKNDIIIKAKAGIKFLGAQIFPKGRRLNKRNWYRADERLNFRNVSSYAGLVAKHDNEKKKKYFSWIIFDKLINEQFL